MQVGGSDGLAVPAGAFAVDLAVGEPLVHFAGPFEAVGELVFVDFVVVVDEDGRGIFRGLVRRVFKIAGGGELMGVPGEVDVEGRDGHVPRVGDHDMEEGFVFVDEAVHGFHDGGRVYPVDLIHLLHERALADDRAGEVHGEHGYIIPVAGHHPAERYLFIAGKG